MKSPIRIRLQGIERTAESKAGRLAVHHLTLADQGREGAGGELLVHDDLKAIDALEAAWRRLTPGTASPFQTFSWNLAWYRVYAGASKPPLVFEWRREGEARAILPCYREGKAIRLAGDRICDYQDILAEDDRSGAEALREVCAWIGREVPGGHLRCDRVSSEGGLRRLLSDPTEAGAAAAGALVFEKPSVPCPFVDLRGGLDGYLSSLPRKVRQDLRNSLHRFDRDAAGARIVILRDFEIRVDDLWNAASFHVGHSRKGRESPFRDPRLIDFLGRVAKDPDAGLQISFLSLQGEMLAVDFGFARGGRYYGYLTAYDPAYSRLSPGKCLLLRRIDRWVAEDGVRILDFLGGDEAYKRIFAGDSAYRVWSMRLLPPGARNRALHFALEADKGLRRVAKRFLGRKA